MITQTQRISVVFTVASLMAMLFVSCTSAPKRTEEKASETSVKATAMLPPRTAFQQTIDGKKTDLFVIKNERGMQAAITSYGGRLVSLVVPDNRDSARDVVIGFDNVMGYKNSTEPYYGATIGRVGNRIAKGKFTLDGKVYSVFTNNGPNTLHGGKKGFQDVVWDTKESGDSSLELSYTSKDMEEGFPGKLDVKVTYTITANNELKIEYEAATDKRTVVNLTNHAFFNLNGAGSGTITDHMLMINADSYTPVDSTLIPTGKIEPVAGTAFDFRKPEKIGARIDSPDEQLKFGKGYDHNFVLNKTVAGLTSAAEVTGDKSGIVMDVFTTEPGLQFYSGNFMQSKNSMKGGSKDDFRTAFCMETQHFPDAPNQRSFPSIVLDPGKKYSTYSVYRFSVKK